VYCKCSNVLCKVDRFIGSNLNECNKNNKGLLQNVHNTIKNVAKKVLIGAAHLGNIVVNTVARATKGVIRGGYKAAKTLYSGLKSGYKAIKRLGSKIANIGKSVFNWLF